MTVHCFYCETSKHVRPKKRDRCMTLLCDCCRKPVAFHQTSRRNWCRSCELEFKIVIPLALAALNSLALKFGWMRYA